MESVMVPFIIWLAVMIPTVWLAICNNRANEQRKYLLHRYLRLHIGRDTFDHNHSEFERVSYSNHLWSLFRLGDPMKLYDFR